MDNINYYNQAHFHSLEYQPFEAKHVNLTCSLHSHISPSELNYDSGDFWKWMHDDFLHLDSTKHIYPIQKQIIESIELDTGEEPRNYLTIIPTSGGKSAIFQAPILYKAVKKDNKRISFVISPLQALMKEQVDKIIGADNSLKGRVDYIHSGRTGDEINSIIEKIKNKDIILLYVTPERIMNRLFWKNVVEYVMSDIGQGFETIVFDEAHCIVSWGMDFRPEYVSALRKCVKLQTIDKDLSLQMYSATIPARSRLELISEINIPETHIFPKKESEEFITTLYPIKDFIDIHYKKIDISSDEGDKVTKGQNWDAKCQVLSTILQSNDYLDLSLLRGEKPVSRMLIFTRLIEEAENLKKFLCNLFENDEIGSRIDFFHSKIGDSHAKDEITKKFMEGDIVILITTKAFGMGMDIPNIHCVIHMTPPQFMEDYLQEVGRAGRKRLPDCLERVHALCLYTQYDLDFNAPENPPKSEVSWKKVINSFDCIRDYLRTHGYTKGYLPVPINLLEFSETMKECFYDLRTTSKGKPYEDLNETFYNCINWLSKRTIINDQQIGLNRIEIGFRCPRFYEVTVNQKVTSIHTDDNNLLRFFEYIIDKQKGGNPGCPILIDSMEILSDKNFQFDDGRSIEDVEALISEFYERRIFLRDHSILCLSLSSAKRKAKYVQEFVESKNGHKILPDMEILCQMLHDVQEPIHASFDEQLFKSSIEKLTKNGIKFSTPPLETIRKAWPYFYSLSRIYSPEEIKRYCESLIIALYKLGSKHVNWIKLASEIGLGHDPEALKVFAIALHKNHLNYATKFRAIEPRDYIEIQIINDLDVIDDPTLPSDSSSKKQIDEYYKQKHLKTRKMRSIIERYVDPMRCKTDIISYSSDTDSNTE